MASPKNPEESVRRSSRAWPKSGARTPPISGVRGVGLKEVSQGFCQGAQGFKNSLAKAPKPQCRVLMNPSPGSGFGMLQSPLKTSNMSSAAVKRLPPHTETSLISLSSLDSLRRADPYCHSSSYSGALKPLDPSEAPSCNCCLNA